ncbi:hypothetical protein P175DRAFT_0503260 [Aspergillus ochraceoroseus IBT 24754]|uniref:Diaminohydroxyphosphoribosylamino-pyrimidine deaminase n=1 Tax=Aspergillus ochraceoroseus IBT 24754 TaxID=1392256 RepID=A0A2T5LQ98_9EURO|nr:uncharacterized protein P175DRAFT_0503260 [Aspergillus ochraceoroseus IBT 24754]PTU18464.1 hypothetical protein P175DRAFT_0503260 [Aspergillus ochraceoroseus IBT 24754]
MELVTEFLKSIGDEVDDAEEESFLLFSQDIPSSNLGFVDSKATSVDLTIHDHDYTIHQSPTLLSSSRAGGTTGAVLWKITPLFAEWISSRKSNPLWTHSLLSASSTAVELGCGISGLVSLTLAPQIQHYIATDQEYVHRLFRENLENNPPRAQSQSLPSSSRSTRAKKQRAPPAHLHHHHHHHHNITFTSLDWELDHPETLKDSISVAGAESTPAAADGNAKDPGFDLLVSCDCIYNEALVAPFVRTCAEISRLRPGYARPGTAADGRPPTVCVIAQQQRSPDVFEAWLQETLRYFRVWRVRDEVAGEKLKLGTGYLVHVLLLRCDVGA